jgi:hypothetical protein
MLERVGDRARCLAHEMVGEAADRNAIARRVREPPGEVRALGQQEREVVEARVAARRTGALLLDDDEQRLSTGAERDAAVVALEDVEPDGTAVVVERPAESETVR